MICSHYTLQYITITHIVFETMIMWAENM